MEEQLDQLARLLVTVVDALQHAVFHRDEVARRVGQVVLATGQQLGHRVLAIQRDQIIPQGIGRRVQRDCQSYRAILRQPIDHRHHTRGGHRDAAPGQAVAMIVQHHAQRRNQGRVILQGLAHAHHDDVGNDPLAALPPLPQSVLSVPELRHDLGGAQIATESLMPGRAKPATDGATGLGRNTQGAAVGLGNENGLNGVSLADVEQPLRRSIGGRMLGQDRQSLHPGLPLQLVTQ